MKVKRICYVPRTDPTVHLLRAQHHKQKVFVFKDRKGQVVDNVQRCLLYFLLGDCISGW